MCSYCVLSGPGVRDTASSPHTVVLLMVSICFQGLLTAFESLASQAYGSGNRRRVGVLYQRAVVVLAIAFIPVR
jgi:Na+-driven multidrug efflux pump